MERRINLGSISGWTRTLGLCGTVCVMTIFDYALNIGLIALVVLQMRGRRLDRRGVVLPLALVGWAASQYLHGIPTVGNDGLLVTGGVMAGLILGAASAPGWDSRCSCSTVGRRR